MTCFSCINTLVEFLFYREHRPSIEISSNLGNFPVCGNTSMTGLTIDTAIQISIQILSGFTWNTTFISIYFWIWIWFIWIIVCSPTILLIYCSKVKNVRKTQNIGNIYLSRQIRLNKFLHQSMSTSSLDNAILRAGLRWKVHILQILFSLGLVKAYQIIEPVHSTDLLNWYSWVLTRLQS